ncbi:hypothetical protein [Marinobacterium arenosum]|uniref:hypothetical protein n=1 Tax=Marinobacterium arenosum TaxID=2862496 RepID=UPI001C964F1F|nr:hypothetical protein [Marinobacterium arenosum]MBY4675908.1 hypothetical protein [Marinobacterium arenosum]
MDFLLDNKEWLFSGAGIFVISLITGLFISNKLKNKQIQKSGSNSRNYQSARDINIGKTNDK